ncbi:MAG TPA: S41 family peptidase [Rhodanobacteraceae bacterium]|nr:S41 family peptidase [Rhodanobacteraceae bacterium]
MLRRLTLVLALALAVPALADPAAEAPPAAVKDGVSLQDIRTFTAVYHLVKQAYVEDKSDAELMQAAIKGLLSGLDPHSEYLDQRELTALTEDTSGAYEGLGIEVFSADGVLRVIAPIDDTPAERAGIKPGDIITRIDGKTITRENAGESVELLRGKPGSEVTLTVLHEGASVPIEVKLKRETIRVSSVKARWIEPGYAWLRVAQFQEDTGSEVRKKLARLREKAATPLHGVVLDLRSNPGGLLTSAVEVSDAFLDSGTIVTTRGRLKEADLSFGATPGDISGGAPLVVLVDKGTASAAEIVAGALKDNRRGLVMGQKTFGKGSVQTVLPLDDGHAVKLTTARYFTPSGVSIQAAGIVPDIALRDLRLTVRDSAPTLYTSERDLPNHLKGDHEADGAAPKADAGAGEGVGDDYALSEALHVLKAMALRAPAAAERKG